MPALEPIGGFRVVASPDALDGARWTGDAASILRIAPDEALGLGVTQVAVDDPDAIVEPESGFVVAYLDAHEQRALAAHVDWALPIEPGALGQGKIAGVPARLLVGTPSLLVIQAAYADELRSRLGW